MYDKTSREILMIKQKYCITDNDPVFALLDVYGSLLKDLHGVLNFVKETQSMACESLHKIKEEKSILAEFIEVHKLQIAEQGVKVGKILNQDMSSQLQELFKSISEYKKGIENERKLLCNDRVNYQNSLSGLIAQYNEDKDAQKKKNNISFVLIVFLIFIQSASIVTLLNFIR